ncbi:MAG: hypothetical protein P8K65_09120, partial [Acidimicrobiales bacterium]|nr:hypothetical protein [Acidimicrobiales bacterium]
WLLQWNGCSPTLAWCTPLLPLIFTTERVIAAKAVRGFQIPPGVDNGNGSGKEAEKPDGSKPAGPNRI